MTVPFDQLSPGQVGRLAYQVLGKNGPIFNPTGIAYLSPQDFPTPPIFDLHSAAAGLAGLNLAASVGNLAVSSVVLREVRQMQQQLSKIEIKLDQLELTLTDVQQRVQRIDTRVSETHLREAFRYCVSNSLNDGSIDLTRYVPLFEDIERVEETLEGGLLFNFGLRLSSDLRDHFQSVVSMLYGVRRNVVCLHNQASAFFPERCIHHAPFSDYFNPATSGDIAQFAILAGKTDVIFDDFMNTIGDAVVRSFMFAGPAEREHSKQLTVEHCYNPLYDAFRSAPTASMGIALSAVLDKLDFDYLQEDALLSAHDVLKLWITQSDASLLFRLKLELSGLKDGYEEVFYPQLIDEIEISMQPLVFSLADHATAIFRMDEGW